MKDRLSVYCILFLAVTCALLTASPIYARNFHMSDRSACPPGFEGDPTGGFGCDVENGSSSRGTPEPQPGVEAPPIDLSGTLFYSLKATSAFPLFRFLSPMINAFNTVENSSASTQSAGGDR